MWNQIIITKEHQIREQKQNTNKTTQKQQQNKTNKKAGLFHKGSLHGFKYICLLYKKNKTNKTLKM